MRFQLFLIPANLLFFSFFHFSASRNLSFTKFNSFFSSYDGLKTERVEKLKRNAINDTLKIIDIWATYYYLPTFSHDENGVDLLDKDENKTGLKLNLCDWCAACIEGSVIILKNNQKYLLNYEGRSASLQNDCRDCEKYKNYDGYLKTGKVLWKKSNGCGEGVKGYKLVPFRTIAVDSSVIPYGSVVFISEAKGVRYYLDEKAQIHDGYFFAGDTGSKIKGHHIDVFIGTSKSNPFNFIKSNSNNTVKAQLVEDPKIITQLEKMHK